jgi:S-adenosyl methyltransferase
VARLFDGLELVEPGITPVGVWRPGPMDEIPTRGLPTWVAVARKP